MMQRTLTRYRRDLAPAVTGALLWMVMVVSVPYLVGRVIDEAIGGDAGHRLGPLVMVVIGTGVLLGVGIGVRRYYGFRLSYRAETDLRNRMFEHIQRLAFSFHDVTSTGELMARASSDLSQMRIVFAMLPITLANLAMFIAVITMLVVLDPVLGLVTSLTVPALLLAARSYAGRVIGLSFDVQQRLADLSQVVEEAIVGFRIHAPEARFSNMGQARTNLIAQQPKQPKDNVAGAGGIGHDLDRIQSGFLLQQAFQDIE